MSSSKKSSDRLSERFQPRMELSGSARKIPQGTNTGNTLFNEVIEVTVTLRRKTAITNYIKALGRGKQKPVSREQYNRRFGASAEDIRLVREFAQYHNLTVVETSATKRTVILKGTVQQFSNAFGVYLANFVPESGISYRGRTGPIKIPESFRDIITGVFGLDNRQQARPMFRMLHKEGHVIKPADATVSYHPDAVAKAYKYPKDVTGAGECIGLIELGGGYRSTDLQAYFQKLGIPLPYVTAQSVDGAHNAPSTADTADGEVALDIEVAGAVAPGANIVVYFAPNTDKGFLDAISAAVHDAENKPSVISISWGAAENQWTGQAINNFNEVFKSAAALGVTIAVAAGDGGSSDRQTDGKAHVDFPAASPYALACGGTKLLTGSETVWNDEDGWATGGGISDVFPVPDYQKAMALPASVNSKQRKGRGVPDIAANADSATGYNILVDGQWTVIGGTSAVAPLISGLIALANQKLKKSVGFIHPKIYAASAAVFKDITQGNNITATIGGYTAANGWDACTGLGVPWGSVVEVL
ncbi:MAG: S53 family peptidase [Bacteroidota bacterium]|nr:S53 family peptidase [Bacteroidota bacterium]MDP4211506.1 S53 family peptidase [Bacteroidota bacterium]MDP4249721.1 S53 family peptidase [Bacteroidota bacterium]